MADYTPSLPIKTTAISIAAGYPITVAELKAELRIPAAETSFDVQLAMYIAAATEEAERFSGLNFREKQISASFSGCSPFLIRGNNIVVSSVFDVAITGQEVALVDYTVSVSDKYAIVFANSDRARIVYNTGSSVVACVIKMAILKYSAAMYSGCSEVSGKNVLTMYLSSFKLGLRTGVYSG